MSAIIRNIKRHMLKTLAAAATPMQEPNLTDAVEQLVTPKPLGSDVSQARRELEAGGFIQGRRDELDDTLVTWSLTEKGRHKAAEL